MGLRPTQRIEMKVAVIPSAAKDLHFGSLANYRRFFAALRMTDFRESEAINLGSSGFNELHSFFDAFGS